MEEKFMSIRVGIMGYGNLGRGIECALKQNDDMELVAVFSRRNPEQVKILTEGVKVYSVEDVVKMNEVEFSGRLPQWNDDSWGYLYRKIRPEHEEMIIVGWAVDICGQVPSMTAQLERIHQTYFGGAHQILFLMVLCSLWHL